MQNVTQGHRYGIWNVRSLYAAGSLKIVTSKLLKCTSDLLAEQEVRLVEGCSQSADNYKFVYGNGSANHHFGTGFSVHKGNISS
jgi:hypothetical protein